MINRKRKTKKRDFYNHYFKFRDLTSYGNERVDNNLKKYDSVKDWIGINYALANIPEKYIKFELKNIRAKILTIESNEEQIEKIEKYIDNLDTAISKGIGLYLSGPHGVAKTTIATIILKEALKKYYKCFFCKSLEIVNFARSGWKSDDRKIYWDYIVDNMDILVIDDIARLFEVTDKERVHIDEIFTKRDDSNLTTIITANHKLIDNRELFGKALYSNFIERLIEINLIGDDYRNIIGKHLIEELE